MEWIDGIKLTDEVGLQKAHLNRRELIDQVLYRNCSCISCFSFQSFYIILIYLFFLFCEKKVFFPSQAAVSIFYFSVFIS